MTHPLRDRTTAVQRHDAIEVLLAPGSTALKAIRDTMRGISDVERITSRIALRQVRPRELAGLRHTLNALPLLRAVVPQGQAMLLDDCVKDLSPSEALPALLQAAIAEEPAVQLRDGGVIASGFDATLDELRGISQNCDAFLLDLETRERARTGIANLRVQFNKVHGFFIEVTQGQIDKVPADYQRRQTLKNAERYITPELKAFEDKALSAQDRALAREKQLFEELLSELMTHLQTLSSLARALATLDAVAALAEKGILQPVVDQVFPLKEAAEAQRRMESRQNFGKIILKVGS